MFSAARNQQLDPKYVIDDLDKLMVAAVVITFYSTAIIVLISAVAGASAQHRMTEAVHAPEATYKKEMVQSRQEDQLLKMALELSRASAPTLASPMKSSGSPLAAVQIPRERSKRSRRRRRSCWWWWWCPSTVSCERLASYPKDRNEKMSGQCWLSKQKGKLQRKLDRVFSAARKRDSAASRCKRSGTS